LEVATQETDVAPLKDMNYEARMGQVRSSGRVNSRVAMAVEWNESHESDFLPSRSDLARTRESKGWELGLELDDSNLDFWGLDF
jgi:hypothetical protein